MSPLSEDDSLFSFLLGQVATCFVRHAVKQQWRNLVAFDLDDAWLSLVAEVRAIAHDGSNRDAAHLACTQSPKLKRTLSEETIPNLDDAETAQLSFRKDTDNGKGGLMSNNPYYSVLGDCCTILVSFRVSRRV